MALNPIAANSTRLEPQYRVGAPAALTNTSKEVVGDTAALVPDVLPRNVLVRFVGDVPVPAVATELALSVGVLISSVELTLSVGVLICPVEPALSLGVMVVLVLAEVVAADPAVSDIVE